MALGLVSTSLVILTEAQSWAVRAQERSTQITTATMLADTVMKLAMMRMLEDGFGELEVRERGDFRDQRYGESFEDFRWEWEAEKVQVRLPDMNQVMGLMGEGASALGDAAGVDTGGAAPANELAALDSLGLDMSMFSDMLGNYLREIRVRVCYPDGKNQDGIDVEDCVELTSHLVNPTGRVMSEEEQLLLEAQEDAQE
ncbi:MAG: hypothetical protein CL928_02685 [Deltaproteobacteria bacterium]|nr:hypothetical protein [Deltaproteobacteria bacterium]